jgi:hypothetical protein
VNPKTAKKQRNDEFTHEQWLNFGYRSKVQGECLKHQRSNEGDPTEQPERLAKQEKRQLPSRRMIRLSSARDVLRGEGECVSQRRKKREENRQCLT